MVVLRLGKTRLLLPVSGKIPEHKQDYYSVTKDLNKMGKGPFSHVGHFVQGCSMIFQLAFVCETGSPDWPQNVLGRKIIQVLPSSSLKGTQEEVTADTVGGWNTRD